MKCFLCKYIIIITLLCSFPCMPLPADAAPGNGLEKSVAQYGLDIEFYYKNPRPDILPGMLRVLDEKRIFAAPDKSMTVSAFLGEIFRKDPRQTNTLDEAAANLSPKAQDVVQEGKKMAALQNGIPRLLCCDMLQDATRISMCWAAFGASGDIRFVDAVIEAACDFARRNAAGSAHDLRFRIGQEAARTLFDYARRHPAVMSRCKELRGKKDPPSAEMLRRVIEG